MDPSTDAPTAPEVAPAAPSSPADAAETSRLLETALFEVKKVIVGQERALERLVVCLLARGHVLLEGVPGLAKTLAIETLATVSGCSFTRLQFTPDLLPADIVGTRIYRASSEQFDVELGPIFANFVLADEVNRAPAKVQSALLEVMAEHQVSIGGQTFPAPDPFLVLATQNPIESEGVYPLPEAQRDRFLMKVVLGYPTPAEEVEIVYRMSEINHPYPPARAALRGLYAHYAENGVSRDSGAYVRSRIVRALRGVALAEDVDIFGQAVTTYEFPPPAFKEEAALLRAGGLVALSEWDEAAACFHATRLLADPLTDPMSGQPALAAVDVLAAFDETLPLFFYAMQAHERVQPEIVGECLRRMISLPASVLPSVLHHYAECARPGLLVGVVDLLIQHPDGSIGLDFLARLLHQPPDLDLYRYLAAALLAVGKPELRALLAESARMEQNPARVAVLMEVLAELEDQPEWREVVGMLAARRRTGR